MPRKIHMQDQAFNKVDDIMNHYQRKPLGGLMRMVKPFRKPLSVDCCRADQNLPTDLHRFTGW